MDVTLAATSQALQDCSHRVAQTQEIVISECTDVTIENVQLNQAIEINGACFQDNFLTDATADNDKVAIAVAQQARAVNDALGVVRKDAENVATAATHLSTKIQTDFFQKCQKSLSAVQGILLKNCKNVTVRNVDFTQSLNDTTTCVQQNSSNTSEVSALTLTVDQTASASAQNKKKWLTTLLIVVAILAVVALLGIVLKPKAAASSVVAEAGGTPPNAASSVVAEAGGTPRNAAASVVAEAGGTPRNAAASASALGGGKTGSVTGVKSATTVAMYVVIAVFAVAMALSTACVVGYPVSVFTSTTLFPYGWIIPTLPPAEFDDDGLPVDPTSDLYRYQNVANSTNDTRNRGIQRRNKNTFYVSLGVAVASLLGLIVCVYVLKHEKPSRRATTRR
jgi:hypothetical protein